MVTEQIENKRPEVLIVEDHPITRKLMSTWLEMSGYRVRQASDGTDAWKSAQNECPPIVVTDWNMPQMSGLDLCRYIREQHGNNQVYVLIATSRDTGADLTEAMDAGANDFLSKPIREDEFLARIRNAEASLQRLRSQTALAEIEPLTGLLNRRAFFERGQKMIDRARRESNQLSCIALDIDLFKNFNDENGHGVGDQILLAVANILNDECRENDLLCRLGGDEFCMLLDEADETDAMEVAERIRKSIAAKPITVNEDHMNVHVTLGVAPLAPSMESLPLLIDTTDRVLLAAKNEGRDRSLSLSSLRHRRSDFNADTVGSHPALRATLANEIMTDTTTLVYEDQTLSAALQILLQSGKDCACVVDRSSKLVGMVTERDFLSAYSSGSIAQACVHNVMSRNIARFREDTQVVRIWESLQRNPMLRNVIVDESDAPVGLVRRQSLLQLLNGLDKTHTASVT